MTGQFKKDNSIFGALLGTATIAISFLLIFTTIQLVKFDNEILQKKLFLMCVIPNIFLVRYYLKVLFYEKTGKSILFVSFVFLIVFMIYFFKR
jgi:hypothetical protein